MLYLFISARLIQLVIQIEEAEIYLKISRSSLQLADKILRIRVNYEINVKERIKGIIKKKCEQQNCNNMEFQIIKVVDYGSCYLIIISVRHYFRKQII